MPKLTGFEVLELIKKGLQEDIVFYILTTSLTDSDLKKCQDLKIGCYKKPFSFRAFQRGTSKHH
jgi:CheY-like chemotaxis protein